MRWFKRLLMASHCLALGLMAGSCGEQGVSGVPLIGNASTAKHFETSPGVVLALANLASVRSNANASGDATVVVSNETSTAFIRPEGRPTCLKVEVKVAGSISTLYDIIWEIKTSLTGIHKLQQAYHMDVGGAITSWSAAWYFCVTSTCAQNYTYNIMNTTPNLQRPGWSTIQKMTVLPDATVSTVTRDSTFQRIRMRLTIPANQTGTMYFCDIWANVHNAPKVVFSFDDSIASHYSVALPYLSARGLKGSLAVKTSSTGLSVAQMQDFRDKGWSFHNHTHSHIDLTQLSQADCVIEIQAAAVIMSSNNLSYGFETMVPPGGATNATVAACIKQTGMTHSAIARSQLSKMWEGFDDPMQIDRWPIAYVSGTAVDLPAFTAVVDQAMEYGTYIIFYAHDIFIGATGTNTELATFQGLVNYVANLHAQGKLEVITLQYLVDGIEYGEEEAKRRARLTVN